MKKQALKMTSAKYELLPTDVYKIMQNARSPKSETAEGARTDARVLSEQGKQCIEVIISEALALHHHGYPTVCGDYLLRCVSDLGTIRVSSVAAFRSSSKVTQDDLWYPPLVSFELFMS